MLLFKSFRCYGHKIVPDIHSSIHPILPFFFLMFCFHLMAIRKHDFSVLLHKDKMMCWECAVSGMGNSRRMT